MQTRPPGFGLVAVFDAMAGKARGAGGDQRGIEAARQQHAVGHVAHQLAMHRGSKASRSSCATPARHIAVAS
jgi:hypothetical protein